MGYFAQASHETKNKVFYLKHHLRVSHDEGAQLHMNFFSPLPGVKHFVICA